MIRKKTRNCILVTFAFNFSNLTTSIAEEAGIAIKAGIENFKWKEYHGNEKLLEESGNRSFLGLAIDRTHSLSSEIVYNHEAKFYGGDVIYDGQTQAGVPVKSNTGYSGLLYSAEFGRRLELMESKFAWDILFGLKLDMWDRDIKGGLDETGNFARGYKESYTIVSGNAGTGPVWKNNYWFGRFLLGFSYPFFTKEVVQGLHAPLEPKGQTSIYFKMHNQFPMTKHVNFILDLYYDAYQFGQSDPVSISNDIKVWQPDSSQETLGLQIGVSGFF